MERIINKNAQNFSYIPNLPNPCSLDTPKNLQLITQILIYILHKWRRGKSYIFRGIKVSKADIGNGLGLYERRTLLLFWISEPSRGERRHPSLFDDPTRQLSKMRTSQSFCDAGRRAGELIIKFLVVFNRWDVEHGLKKRAGLLWKTIFIR